MNNTNEKMLTPVAPNMLPEVSASLISQAQDYVKQAKSENTRKAYESDWQDFTAWCNLHNCHYLPALPETVTLYLTDLISQHRKVSTLARRLVAISQAHKYHGHTSPTIATVVRETLKGIRREHGSKCETVDALTTADIRTICQSLPDSIIGKRDRTLLLLGFAGAFRRSELVNLNIDDIEESTEGLRINIRHSKTDQEGEGRMVGIPYGSDIQTCPVRSYKLWIETSGITADAIFRGLDKGGHIISIRLSDRAVAQIIQRTTQHAGLNHKHVAGHSLRAGHATSAARAGVSERIIMKQTGHRSEKMVRRYIREGQLFTENSAALLGL
ncbi:MAG: site-specific integrase [bacterium]